MKARKIIITLLVVVFTLSVLLAAVACTPTPPPNNNNNKNGDEEEEEFDLGVMLDTEVGTIVEVVDNTIQRAFAIDGAAHVSLTAFATIAYGGSEDLGPINLDAEIKIEASFDQTNANKNAVLIEVKDNSVGGLGVIASIFAKNDGTKEVLYIGQQIWSSEFAWVKMSQADDAGILAGFVVDKVMTMITGMYAENQAKIDAGIVDGMVGQFLTFIPMIAPLGIIVPTTAEVTEAGFAVTAANANFAETKVAGGTELELMVEEVGGLAGVLGAFVNFADLRASIAEGGLLDLVNLMVDLILGQSFDQLFSLNGETPDLNPIYPTIAIGVGHNGTLLTGIGLHYDYTNNAEMPLKLDLGIKNLVIETTSATVVPAVAGYLTAGEAAIELAMDVVLDNGTVDATINVYAYPTVSVSLVELESLEEGVVPFIDLDLTGIQGFATITDNNSTPAIAQYIADFQAGNEAGLNGFKLDLGPIIGVLGLSADPIISASEQQFFIPLEAQAMWDNYFAANTTGFGDPAANQSIIDDVLTTVDEQFADGFAIGDIMAFLGFIPQIMTEVEALMGVGNPIQVAAFVDGDRSASVTIDIAALMTELLGVGGIIADTERFEFTTYYNNLDGTLLAEPVKGDLATYLAADAVVESVVTFMNYNTGVAEADKTYGDAYKAQYAIDHPEATEEEIAAATEVATKAAKEAFFDDDPATTTTWELANITGELFTTEDATRIFAAVTGKTLDPADAYAGLSVEAFVSVGAGDKTAREGISLGVELSDATLGTLASVELNLNIKAENTVALAAYEASGFATMWSSGTYANTGDDDGKSLFDLLLNVVTTYAEVVAVG